MTTIVDIERRLRLPAPDEPAALPKLILPLDADADRVTPTVRFRTPVTGPRDNRLVYAVVALVLLMLAIIVAGALRLLNPPLTSTVRLCEASIFQGSCLSVDVPDGWHQLALGSLFPGDYGEAASGLGYERVELVLATGELSACPSPAGSLPGAVPSDGVTSVPREAPDAGLVCIRAAPLPENGVRVQVLKGQRISEVIDGAGILDTTEPSVANGWTEEIAGRPARLVVAAGDGGPGSPAEIRTWDILLPRSIDKVVRIRAEIAGPALEDRRAAVQGIVDSVTFDEQVSELDPADAAGVLRSTIDMLDAGTQQSGSDFYGCFPRDAGSVAGTISGGPSGPLEAPLDVTCASSISASRAGLWRIDLDVTWEAGKGHGAGGVRSENFTDGTPAGYAMGVFVSLDGRPPAPEGINAWLPGGEHPLPPLLEGPLNLSPRSIAELLSPGQIPVPELDPTNDVMYPSIVGRHLYVLDGPEVVDGDEWYRVQWGEGPSQEIAWARGTRDGRPLLLAVDPHCPEGDASLAELSRLIPAERVSCFGNRDLTLAPSVLALVEPFPQIADLCQGPDEPEPTSCPTGDGAPAWLTQATTWWLYGEGGADGADPGLPVWLDPLVTQPPDGALGRVVGHFDDPAATGCRWGPSGTSGLDPTTASPDVQELVCRQRFVITRIEPSAPGP